MKLKQISIFLVLVVVGFPVYSQNNGVSPVGNFQLARYLGTWYEIARYDHYFERNLEEVTANYSLRDDGKVRVINSGYNSKKQARKSVEGYGVISGASDIGELKVTFFWPFFAPYRIALLDPDYQYALVVGDNYDYVWILSRKPVLEKKTLDLMIAFLRNNGFDPDKLIWVKH